MIDPAALARKSILDIPRYKTGVSPHLLQALASGTRVARLASNENPYGPSPSVYDAMRAIDDVHRYPDGANTHVREAIGAHLALDPARITVSTGSENVLSAIFHCVVSPGDRVVTLTPTFMFAEILTKALGAEHVAVGYDDDLSYSAEAVAAAVDNGAKILYVSNPNNPTGNAFSPEELDRIVERTDSSTLVVIDEAYFEYAAHHDGYASSLPTLESSGRPYVVLRTFSKAYGLAGLRVGYGIAYDPELVPLIRRASTIFDVGTLAQTAAVAALGDPAHMKASVERTLADKARVLSTLTKRGVRCFPSFGNFVSLWCRTRDDAMRIEAGLAEHAVFVKALPAHDGEGLVRVSIGKDEDNDRFLEALDALS